MSELLARKEGADRLSDRPQSFPQLCAEARTPQRLILSEALMKGSRRHSFFAANPELRVGALRSRPKAATGR